MPKGSLLIPKAVKKRKEAVNKRMQPLINLSIEARKHNISLGKYKEILRARGELYV